MNQELQKQLAQLIEKATAAGQTAWEFAAEQAPELIQQLLKWKLFESISLAVGFALIAVVSAFFIRWGVRRLKKDEWDTPAIPMLMLGSIGAIVFLFLAANRALDAAQIYLAPKVYLIEYLSHLTK